MIKNITPHNKSDMTITAAQGKNSDASIPTINAAMQNIIVSCRLHPNKLITVPLLVYYMQDLRLCAFAISIFKARYFSHAPLLIW